MSIQQWRYRLLEPDTRVARMKSTLRKLDVVKYLSLLSIVIGMRWMLK